MSDACPTCRKPWKYQGWSNYETWAVKLWIDNDEPVYRYWRDVAQDAWQQADDAPPTWPSQTRSDRARILLTERLKSEFDDNAELPESGVYADLLNAALSEIDWFEIADSLLADYAQPDGAELPNEAERYRPR